MDWELDPEDDRHQDKNAGSKTAVDNQGVGLVWDHVATTSEGRTYGGVGKVGEVLRQEIYDCAFCKGTGMRPKGSRCPVCKGQETVHVQPPAVVCAFCKGTGEEIRRSTITCSVCKGKGVVSVQEPVKRCPTCNGRGRQIGSSLYCMSCKGKGVVIAAKTTKEGEESVAIRRPSGSEWDALEIIHELGKAGRHGVGGRMHVGATYADYVCKSLLKKGLIERESRDIFVLSEVGEKIFEKIEAEKPIEGLDEEEKISEDTEVEEETTIDKTKLKEYKIS